MKTYMHKCAEILIVFSLTAGLSACKKGEANNSSTNNTSNNSTETAENNTATTESNGSGTAVEVDLSYLEGVYEGSCARTSYYGKEPSTSEDDSPYVVILVNGIPMVQEDNKKGALRQQIVENKKDVVTQLDECTTSIEFDTESMTGNWTFLGGGNSPNVYTYTFVKKADGTITLNFFHTIYDDDDTEKKLFDLEGSYTRVSGF